MKLTDKLKGTKVRVMTDMNVEVEFTNGARKTYKPNKFRIMKNSTIFWAVISHFIYLPIVLIFGENQGTAVLLPISFIFKEMIMLSYCGVMVVEPTVNENSAKSEAWCLAVSTILCYLFYQFCGVIMNFNTYIDKLPRRTGCLYEQLADAARNGNTELETELLKKLNL